MVSWQLAGLVLGSTPQERIIPGLQVTVIGMSVVFSVLILLYFILTLMGRFGSDRAAGSSAGSGTPASPEPIHPVQPVQQAEVAGATTVSEAPQHAVQAPDDRSAEQLAAVIAAVIAAATPDGTSAPRQIQRRRDAQLGWAMAGRIALHTARESLPRG